LRIAEFGFFGVRVITWMHTPRRNGEFSKAGDLDLYLTLVRPLRTSWLIVGICVKFAVKITVSAFGETERGIYQTRHEWQHYFPAFLEHLPREPFCPHNSGHESRAANR
jgi:hypothetical protein